MRQRNLFNMMECVMRSVKEDDDGNLVFEVSQNEADKEQFSYSEFCESFIPAFCCTSVVLLYLKNKNLYIVYSNVY